MVGGTGADFGVLHDSIALEIGVSPHACQRHAASGIGGRQPVFLYRSARMRLGSWELRVPVGFVEREDLPPLLGRYRCLDVFDVRFRNFATTFSRTDPP